VPILLKEAAMERRLIGYLEGTDSLWLTTLEANGHDTLPISNGFDSHGRHIGLINKKNLFDLVIGYFHKLMPPVNSDTSVGEILHRTTVYNIPVLAVCPSDLQEKARSQVEDWPQNVEFVDPGEVPARAMELLQ
jgi:hypothetical protein